MIVLGIIGSRARIEEKFLYEEVLQPIIDELKALPDKILVPAEGNSSVLIHSWAEAYKIPVDVVRADWRIHGKKAPMMANAKIQKDSTHFLVLLGQRSPKNEQLAERLAKKGNTVFTLTYSHPCVLEIMSSSQQVQGEHDHKSSKGKGTLSQKEECSKGSGNRQQQQGTWVISSTQEDLLFQEQ
jgi:hypothetical protein